MASEKKKGEEKKPRGPSRLSGAVSVGLGVFAMLWTFAVYMQKGPGLEALFGIVFVFLCLTHAVYNFKAVSRQEAIDRGEVSDPAKGREPVGGATGKDSQKERRYPLYRVKRKPALVCRRGTGTVQGEANGRSGDVK